MKEILFPTSVVNQIRLWKVLFFEDTHYLQAITYDNMLKLLELAGFTPTNNWKELMWTLHGTYWRKMDKEIKEQLDWHIEDIILEYQNWKRFLHKSRLEEDIFGDEEE